MSDVLNDIGKKVMETFDGLTKKADEVITIQGLKSKQRQAQRAIDDCYYELGKIVYGKYKDGVNVAEEAKEFCAKVEEQFGVIAKLDEEIEAARIKKDEDIEDWFDEDEVVSEAVDKAKDISEQAKEAAEEAAVEVENAAEEIKAAVEDAVK